MTSKHGNSNSISEDGGFKTVGVKFPPTIITEKASTPSGEALVDHFVLVGAGIRLAPPPAPPLIPVTAIGIYVNPAIVGFLSNRWSGTTSDKLLNDEAFFSDVIRAPNAREVAQKFNCAHFTALNEMIEACISYTGLPTIFCSRLASDKTLNLGWESLVKHWKLLDGIKLQKEAPGFVLISIRYHFSPVEVLLKIVFLKELTGEEFAKKTGAGTLAILQAIDRFGEEERAALLQYQAICQPVNRPVGSSIFLRVKPSCFGIIFRDDESTPTDLDTTAEIIECPAFGKAFLATILGKGTVSPAAKSSFAEGMSNLLNNKH